MSDEHSRAVQQPLRQCCHAGCRKLVRGAPRCQKHTQAKREQEGRRRHDPGFYSRAKWRKLRDLKREEDPLCERCLAAGRVRPTEHVHHIKSRRDYPKLEYELTNLESLCLKCHSTETLRHGGRGEI